MDIPPEWYIDQSDNGNYYLKFLNKGQPHNSDGAGEGFLSIFTIVDALYDSAPGDLIFIDEPELSLHPSLQRKLLNLLLEYSSSRQIVIATHSPFFISWESLLNGGKIARTVKTDSGNKIFQMSDSTAGDIRSLVDNLNNPHILGLDAKEIFFLEDNVILLEGQEDVVFMKKILGILKIDVLGSFFGWGIGGAGNVKKIVNILKDLGFNKVTTILDNNKEGEVSKLTEDYKSDGFLFLCIPTNDVRDKPEVPARAKVDGLIDSGGTSLKPEFEEHLKKIFDSINGYFAI